MSQKSVLRNYEFVCIFTQDMTEQAVRKSIEDYTKKVKDAGGEVTKTEFCGIRTFAYPIQKKKKGYYILLNLRLPSDFVKPFEQALKLDFTILRYLLVKVKTLDPNPSELLQQRHNLDVVYRAQIRSGKVYQGQQNREESPAEDLAQEEKGNE